MLKVVAVLTLLHLACANPLLEKKTNENRHKRLLFYDEQGNLIQTYNNPLRDFPEQFENFPFFGPFFQPLYNYIRPISTFGGRPMTYMIPVSDEVIHQISQDPIMQNKLILLPRDPVVEHNTLCLGKRAQIPSPKSCSNFLNCWDGWAFEQECPSGLLFSNEGFCDYPQRVNCNNRRMNARPAAQIPQCSSDYEAFRSEWSCAEFFVCVNRQPVRFQCPADLAFNTDFGICDYPARVNCTASAGISGTAGVTAPAAATTVDATAPSDGKTVVLKSSVYNSQSWSSSSHVAMSRQDAVRQLQLGRIANVNTAY